ncbi:MAG: cobalamin-dependent protein, partial [Candidatus Woesearchaeota archaeon]|nr:cobalamin-dependent protein [Candidatus Woesearchaeota archaeon]
MAKVMFLQDVWFPLQGVMNLSASLKKAGHQTDVAVGTDDEIFAELKKFNPDIVALSSMTAYRDFMIRTTKRLKKESPKCIAVVGGFDSSFFPEIIEQVEEIDVLCRGEGNDALVELANALDKKADYTGISNLWVKKNGKIYKNELAPFIGMDDKDFDDHEIYRKYKYFRDIEFVQIMAG